MKRGISLIAVLMFMLAATTASVVVFRWISSENFASGARLKHTESYKAAESGVEAVHAWLSNKGADVGALVSNYYYNSNGVKKANPTPIMLTNPTNNILGIVNPDGAKQSFNVYLMGIDQQNSSDRLKFKFLSVGKGRDGSEVKLSAIFDVVGLYQTNVLGSSTRAVDAKKNDYDYAYYGGDIKFSGQRMFTSMAVSGDWTGNPPTVERDFVVTGNLLASGSEVNVGNAQTGHGTLCVGGTFDPNNNKGVVQDAYWGNAINLGGSFKNVYSNGNMEINFSNTSMENLTLNGRLYFRESASRINVKGNLVIDDNDNAFIDANKLDANGVGQGGIVVCDTIWTQNSAAVRGTPATRGRLVRFAANSDRPAVCNKSDAILAFMGATGGPESYVTLPPPGVQLGYFTSSKNNLVPSVANKPTTVNAVKDYCDDKWQPVPPGTGCNGSNFVTEDPLAISLTKIKEFMLAKSPACAIGADKNGIMPIMNGGTSNVLNSCFSSTSSDKLYGGKYLVVRWKDSGVNGNQNVYPNSRDATALVGKFIFIYDFDPGTIYVYPTRETSLDTSRVLLFLEKGLRGPQGSSEIRSAGCNASNNPYNYFIYSMAEINEVNGWDKACPLKGSIYFPSSSCAGLTNANNGFEAITNPDLYEDLMDAGILCKRGRNSSGDCTDKELQDTQTGGGGGGFEVVVEPARDDQYWLPVSSRLKASIMSKSISREAIPVASTPSAEKSALVIPRIVRLTTDAFTFVTNEAQPNKLRNFYSLMYLNGASAPATELVPKCCEPPWDQPWDVPCTSNELPNTGKLKNNSFFRCTYDNTGDTKYSDFYIAIKGEAGAAMVSLSPREEKFKGTGDPDGCRDVILSATSNPNGFNVNIKIVAMDGNWSLKSQLSPNSKCTISGTANGSLAMTSNWNVNCPQNTFTAGTAAVFNVCSNRDTDDFIKFGIESATDIAVDNARSEATLIKDNAVWYITKELFKDNDFVLCPNQGYNWLTVTCSQGGRASGNMLLGWQCPIVSGQSVTLALNNPDESCKEYAKNTLSNAQNVLNMKLIPANEGNPYVSFPLDLEWKSYTIIVDGGVLGFETYNLAIPEGKRSGRGLSFTAYHGENYLISYEGTIKKMATCESAVNCNPNPMFLSSERKGTMAPTGDGKITLQDMPKPTANCSPGPSGSVTKGPNLNFTFKEIMPLENVNALDCGVQKVTYTVRKDAANGPLIDNPNYEYIDNQPHLNRIANFSTEGNYYVTAVMECADEPGRATGSIECGRLEISAAAANKCVFQPAWCNNRYIKASDVPARAPDVGNECFFVTSISKFCSGTASRINGRDIGQGLINCWSGGGTSPTEADKRDGGYYVWVGSNVGDWGGTANLAKPDCSDGDDGPSCGYQNSWCGGLSLLQVTHNSNSSCMFVTGITKMNGGTLQINNQSGYMRINGVQLQQPQCGQNWNNAIADKPCSTFLAENGIATIDGGYYINGSNTNDASNNVFVNGTEPNCGAGSGTQSSNSTAQSSSSVAQSSSSSYTITCNISNFTKSCYGTSSDPMPRPNTSCGDGTSGGTAAFKIAGNDVAGWNSLGGTNQMGTARTNAAITLHSLTCGGSLQTLATPVQCGTINVGNCTTTPTISITTHPSNTTVISNNSGTLTCAANVSPSGTPSYQWYKNTSNSNSGGTVVSGATSASYTFPNNLATGSHYYYCVASYTGATEAKSNVATVTVNALPTATCNWPNANGLTLFSGASRPNDPTVTYSGGSCTVGNWSNLPPSGNLTSTGTTTYTPTPNSVTCGGTTPSNNGSISCGTLTVKAVPTISSCTGTSGQNVTLPTKPTQPTVTLNDPGNICSDNGSTTPNSSWTNVTWTVGKNGTDVSNATWANIFDVAGTYTNRSVSGKCGTYSNNLTANCSGNSTVSAAGSGTSITIGTGAGANGTTVPAPSGGGEATFIITCSSTTQPLYCNRGNNTMLRISVNGGSWLAQTNNNSPVTVMSPCVTGTKITIDFGSAGDAICNNRASYW